jgi:hypothetical protein
MDQIKILDVFRIDYPDFNDRIEDEPLGLFIKIRDDGLGIRVNIDNSGQNIDYRIQSYEECKEFIENYYGELTEMTNQSLLNQLLGQNIISVYFALISSQLSSGDNFQLVNNNIFAIQFLTEKVIFTFYNDADEGKYTFDLSKCSIPFLFEGIEWKKATENFWKF